MGGYEETLARTRSFLHAEDHLLEIGCGTGSTALKLAPSVRQITATNVSGGMLGIANGKLQKTGLKNLAFCRPK
jgi:ubiquinone/menaquinone biosynthesis C-methylase UbiE